MEIYKFCPHIELDSMTNDTSNLDHCCTSLYTSSSWKMLIWWSQSKIRWSLSSTKVESFSNKCAHKCMALIILKKWITYFVAQYSTRTFKLVMFRTRSPTLNTYPLSASILFSNFGTFLLISLYKNIVHCNFMKLVIKEGCLFKSHFVHQEYKCRSA